MSDLEFSDEMDSDYSEAAEEVVLTGRKALLATGGRAVQATAVESSEDKANKSSSNKSKLNFFKNKQRVMLLSSRGITHRQRHLMKDLETLLPHSRKDAKFDMKDEVGLLNELAELNNCNNTMYFEARKGQDLYLWLSKTPNGPSAKFLVQNVHTMDELKMTGNCLKGSRPLLSFDAAFDGNSHYALMKQLLIHTFGTPRGHRKSKPFYDHVFSISIVDGRIWFRNFQIVMPDESETKSSTQSLEKEPSMVEIGPRFALNPIRIFDGSFGGVTLYQNPEYISPNAVRALQRMPSNNKYSSRISSNQAREFKKVETKIGKTVMDEVDSIFQ